MPGCVGVGVHTCVSVWTYLCARLGKESLCKCREQERGEREVIFLEVFGVPINR